MEKEIVFLSRKETAKKLGICIPTLERRLKDGTLPSIRIGRRILIPADALERLTAKAYRAGGKK